MVKPRDIPFTILRWGYDFVAERDESGLFVFRRLEAGGPTGLYLTEVTKMRPRRSPPYPVWGDLPAARRVREESLLSGVLEEMILPHERDENGRVLAYRANLDWLASRSDA